MTSFFPVFYKFITRSATQLVPTYLYRYSLFHSLRSAKYKRCSYVLVRELTRGIQDNNLPDTARLLSFCKNRFCLSQLVKKLNSTERGALFRHFCVSKVITTAHAQKVVSFFIFFQELSNKTKKIKTLRPKMTKIASRGSCLENTYKETCWNAVKAWCFSSIQCT